ncbi:glyoxalase/bleomycin resistance/extradiol dioxygenase family protein [Solibacillus sp. R5-41]|uniref:VOC family protein n=1 Tax=Solibacillus sp. R5-41 TaxID=2048654 RepID=UPI000C1267E6|nr:VOC family protein [Solibacillus sp. R5-41]ATP41371.1 glyoxalase/bleomycin resistance/extradiol dioxygenase family protein [Solibacillus sp. R5-41]
MIEQLGQVMLYVDNQEQAKTFWTEKMGFVVISDEDNGMRVITISPTEEAQTSIVLHDKQAIAKMQPELNLKTPSLLFYSSQLDALYEKLKDLNVTIGEMVTMPFGKVFNFADDEGNYFAIVEK